MAAIPYGYDLTPYCGAPPSPLTLISRWNLDPGLILVLLAALAAYGVVSWNVRGAWWRKPCFYTGWLIGALALISPLCPLSASLFSARVGQHMILVSVAAPLIVLGCDLNPERTSAGRNDPGAHRGVLLAALVFAICLWVWHAPGPYLQTFISETAYWAMHLSLFGAACWLWAGLLDKAGRHPVASLAAALFTTVQMGFLGAFITFAPRPLYAAHSLTTVAWSLTPLQDQQLGGAIMWIPAGAILVGAVVLSLGQAIRRSEAGAWAHTAG
jgi:putative membrane protein